MKKKTIALVTLFSLSGLGVLLSLRFRKRVCPKCGREMGRRWRFCPFDGAELK